MMKFIHKYLLLFFYKILRICETCIHACMSHIACLIFTFFYYLLINKLQAISISFWFMTPQILINCCLWTPKATIKKSVVLA
jgi:hypothetical protein